MIIVVDNLKGGTAKTTTAVHLAVNLRAKMRPVTLVDADTVSQTCQDWVATARQFDEWPSGGLDLLTWDPDEITRYLPTYAHRGDVVIDAGAGSVDVLKRSLAEGAQLVIPATPSEPEIRRIPATLRVATEVARIHGVRVSPLVVLARVYGGRHIAEENCRLFLKEHGIPTWEGKIPDVMRYYRSFGTCPMPDEHYRDLAEELLSREAPIGAGR